MHFNRNGFYYACLLTAVLWACAGLLVTRALAQEAATTVHVPCPTSEPCRILILTPQEEKALVTANGVLDTAAQGRALELGQFVVYLKQRIASSPFGEPHQVEKSDKQ